MKKGKIKSPRQKRHSRIRAKVEGTPTRPRLCVFRSLNHIYAQVIDDSQGRTLTCASTMEPDMKAEANGKNKSTRAGRIGSLVAERALTKGITEVVFDRGGYKYHGRIKSLADAARQAGLKF